ncbi:MAG: holo-ACP synthase [Nitrospirae bacterium]|nr:holo-ACP synthase [Nitrospirota bacterium]
MNVERLRAAMDRNEAFAADVFTQREREYCLRHRHPHVHFAGRFAAKEAFLKAIGVGFSTIGVFSGIEVSVMPSGRPTLELNGWADRLVRRLRAQEATVSISHTPQFAVSSVILLRGQ